MRGPDSGYRTGTNSSGDQRSAGAEQSAESVPDYGKAINIKTSAA